MYYMTGGDGREYGPVTVEQLREWIAAGRANGQTSVRQEGDTNGQPLSNYPEFAEALAAQGAAPAAALPSVSESSGEGPPSSSVSPDAEALATEALARPGQINVGLCLGRGWDLLKSDFWPIVGVSAVIFLLVGAASSAWIGLVVNGPLMGGLFAYYLKKLRGQPAQMNDAFVGFSKDFLQLFLGGLIPALLIGIGLALCVLPGIYLAVAWKLTLPIIMDKHIGFWEAMEVSRKLITRHWWNMFLLLLVAAIVNTLGMLCCVVGVFITLPWTMLAVACVYEDFFGSTPTATR